MPLSNRHHKTLMSRLEALRARHRAIDTEIEDYTKGAVIYYGDGHIKSLKVQKLKIKEEIEAIRQAS